MSGRMIRCISLCFLILGTSFAAFDFAMIGSAVVNSAAADEVKVLAKNHSATSGPAARPDNRWDGLVVTHGEGGMQEWKVPIKKAGPHFLHVLYASGKLRPMTLFINDEKQKGEVLGKSTSGFHAPHLKWETLGPYELKAGKNTIRLQAEGHSPHLAGFVVSHDRKKWDRKALDGAFSAKHRPNVPAPRVEANLNIDTDMAKTREQLKKLLPGVEEILFVKRYTLQSSHYYTDFIDGCRHFGGNLCLLSLNDGSVKELVPDLAHGIFGRCDLSYDGKRIVFGWKEKIGVGFRIWEVNIDGTGLRQVTKPPLDEEARIEKYKLNWWKNYMHHTDDMHPCYLPDGGICFASTRCEYGILCDGPDKLTSSVLYRCDADGKNMIKLSNNSVSESAPTIMTDGRILYTRWEYVDNGSVTNKGLWTIRPDGSGTEEIYGMNIAFPSVFNVARQVPGSTNLFVSIGAPHMPLGVGTLMLVDIQFDRRTGECVTYITPEVDTQHQWGWDNIPGGATKPIPPEMQRGRDGRGNTDRGPLYMDPYPLSRSLVIASFNPDQRWNVENAYGLYLVDDEANRNLLHKFDDTSCWNAIPVRKREKPPVVSASINPELAKRGLASVVVADVHRGLDGVKPGTIKYIRVNEHVPRPWASRRFWDGDVYDQQHSVVTSRTHLGLKIQHGIVPVEEDGSAHFLVEADKNIFFQALDKDFVEVQRERTFLNFRPGEMRACVGCHEKPGDNTDAAAKLVLALRKPPRMPGPQPGEKRGARPLSYEVDVQPVWDRHCVECHGPKKQEGKLDLSGERTALFNRSYEQIMGRGLIQKIGENHPKAGNNHYLPPYSLGTPASKLTKFLDKSHYKVNMPLEDRVRVTTWIDSNGQYYGSYYGRKNLKYKDHPNFRPELSFEQSKANTPPLPDDKR